ncbi:MAG: pilus assembly protein [Pirellulaceae bacterium]|nr:pilus assembly protein [Pirellulaceae bacterium]
METPEEFLLESSFQDRGHERTSSGRVDCPREGYLRRKDRIRRSGTAIVETAFVLPVLLTFLFGIFTFGHMQMVANLVQNACRTAAREGAADGMTTEEVRQRVLEIVSSAVDSDMVTVDVRDASVFDIQGADLPITNEDFEALPAVEVADVDPRQLFIVRAQLNYSQVAILSVPWFDNFPISAQTIMRHE